MSTVYNSTGLNDAQSIQATIYPNPVEELIVIKTEATIVKSEVYNLTGEMVRNQSGDVKEMDISKLPTGVYLICVQTKDGNFRQKFVKK
jgi:hypothetical protein